MSLEKKYSLLLKFKLSKKTLEKIAKEQKESKKDKTIEERIELSEEPKWPMTKEDTLICHCNNVSLGALKKQCQEHRDKTLQDLILTNKMGTSCGSCKPIYLRIFAPTLKETPLFISQLYYILIISTVLFILTAALKPIPIPISVQSTLYQIDAFWHERDIKVITGFILFSLILLAPILLALKKRTLLNLYFTKESWKVIHTIIGTFIMVTFLFHTGFRLGSNFNFVLGCTFLGVIFLGILSALFLVRTNQKGNPVELTIYKYVYNIHITVFYFLLLFIFYHMYLHFRY